MNVTSVMSVVCVCQGHVNSVVTAGTAKYQVYEDDVSVPHCVC